MTTSPKSAVLLVNLGTPNSTEVRDVRRYLREFLSDPYVLDIPAPARKALLELVILPTRPRKSAEAYRAVWTEAGSPLLVHSQALTDRVREELGDEVACVELAMRYGEPRIADAIERIVASGAESLIVVPLFPQYSQSAWQSAVVAVDRALAARTTHLATDVLAPFYDDPGFLDACAEVARPHLESFGADRVMFSYHGLPERHVKKTDQTGAHCLARGDCCATIGVANRFCYRAQCYATTAGLVERLGLAEDRFEVAFQSRLGRTPWIQPFTDERVTQLANDGVKRLAVLCPSFVADCLETLEEIGIRAREDFQAAGGEELLLVPCVNAMPPWVRALADSIRAKLGGAGLRSPGTVDKKLRPNLI